MNPTLKCFVIITVVLGFILNIEAMGLCAFRRKFPDKHPIQCGGSKAVTCKEKDVPTVEAGTFKCSGYSVGDNCNLTCDDGYYPSSSKETVCEEKDGKGKWRDGTFQCIEQQQTTLSSATTSQAAEETTPAKSTTTTGQQQTILRADTTSQAAEETTPAKSTTTTGQQQTILRAATTSQAAEETTPAKSTTTTGHQQTTLRAASTSKAAEETTPLMSTTTTANTCQEDHLPAVQAGYFTCSGYSIGEKCNLTCEDGYYPSSSNETVCESTTNLGAKWSDGDFQCSAVTCQEDHLPGVQSGNFNCSGYSVGDKCNLTCYDGYYPSSSNETVCEERKDTKGTWSDGNFECSWISHQ